MSEETIFQKKLKTKFSEKQNTLSENLRLRNDDDLLLLGRLVHYHQIVEDCIMRFLRMKMPDHGSLEKRLRMYGAKLEFFKGFEESSMFSSYFGALKELGDIRNKYAHNLDYKEVGEDKIGEIRKIAIEASTHWKINTTQWISAVHWFSVIFVSIVDGYISMCEANKERINEINESYNRALQEYLEEKSDD